MRFHEVKSLADFRRELLDVHTRVYTQHNNPLFLTLYFYPYISILRSKNRFNLLVISDTFYSIEHGPTKPDGTATK